MTAQSHQSNSKTSAQPPQTHQEIQFLLFELVENEDFELDTSRLCSKNKVVQSSYSGILLIEALLAIVILSVAITATIRSFAYAARVHRVTSEDLQATRLASEKMAELEALPKLQEGESKGIFKRPDEKFSWKLLIEPVSRSSEEEKVATMKYLKTYLKINWELGQAHTISVSTILIKKKDENDEKEKAKTTSTRIYTH